MLKKVLENREHKGDYSNLEIITAGSIFHSQIENQRKRPGLSESRSVEEKLLRVGAVVCHLDLHSNRRA